MYDSRDATLTTPSKSIVHVAEIISESVGWGEGVFPKSELDMGILRFTTDEAQIDHASAAGASSPRRGFGFWDTKDY